MDQDLKRALGEHIAELRRTMLFAVVTIVAFFVTIFTFGGDLLTDIVLRDLRALSVDVVYTTVPEVWTTKLKLSLIAALICSFPFVTFFLWRFLKPALYRHERRVVAFCFLLALLLFLCGVAFAYFLVLPFTLRFFVSFGAGTADAMIVLSRYVGFLIAFIVPFGFIFLLPVAVYLLTKLGLLKARSLAKTRKYVLVLLLVLAAVLTPPDIFSQLMLFLPMTLLWEISIVVAKRTTPIRTGADAD